MPKSVIGVSFAFVKKSFIGSNKNAMQNKSWHDYQAWWF